MPVGNAKGLSECIIPLYPYPKSNRQKLLRFSASFADRKAYMQNAETIGKGQKAMTMRETVEIIRESPLWETLSVGEKMEAIVHAIDSITGAQENRREEVDISDIIGEIFRDNNA